MDQQKQRAEIISMNLNRPGVIHLIEGQEVTLGRSEQNTNPIYDDRIAQFHCSIFFQDGQFVLKNLCQQGTFLNQEKMSINLEVNLDHGDQIHLLMQKGKKVTEKHVIAYMFFRYENKKPSVKKSSKCSQTVYEQIGDDLICIICSELYDEAITVYPCGHTFCGHCLEEWMGVQNETCPMCRKNIKQVLKAYQINKIVKTVLELNPEIQVKKKPKHHLIFADENDRDSSRSEDSESDSDYELMDRLLRGQQIRRQLDLPIIDPAPNQPRVQTPQRPNNLLPIFNNIQQAVPQANQQQQRPLVPQQNGLANQQAAIVNGNPNPIVNRNPNPIANANHNPIPIANHIANPNPNPVVNQNQNQNANVRQPINQAPQQNRQDQAPAPPPRVNNNQRQQPVVQQQQRANDNVQQNPQVNQPRGIVNQQQPIQQPIQQRPNPNQPPQQIRQDPQRQQQNNQQVQQQGNIHQQQPQNQIVQQQQPAQRVVLDCKSCLVEYKGFKCQPNSNHKLCVCQNKLPIRELNTHQNADLKLFCQICKQYFCQFYYGQCQEEQERKISELSKYKIVFNVNHNYINFYEQLRIIRHLGQQDQTIIFDFIMNQYIAKEQFYYQQSKALFWVEQIEINELLLPNSPVCTSCIAKVMNQMILRYVQTLKYEEVQFMMPDCWYGINCRNQVDAFHAREFNHMCEQTKFD